MRLIGLEPGSLKKAEGGSLKPSEGPASLNWYESSILMSFSRKGGLKPGQLVFDFHLVVSGKKSNAGKCGISTFDVKVEYGDVKQ